MIERLTYISTSRNVMGPTHQEVQDILRHSRANNSRDALSGVLVVGGRRFLQVLEGPREALAQAYARIQADARHFALVKLAQVSAEERCFARWAMGYPQESASLDVIVRELTSHLTDPSLKAQLDSFAQMHSKAA